MQDAENALRSEFEKAYDELLEPIYRYFYYRITDRDRAKDLAQETFMRAWMYLYSGKQISNIKPFLYTTASNIFKNELRGRRPVVSLETLMDDAHLEISNEESPPEEVAEARLLMRKLDQLRPAYKEVLVLRFVDGLPPREIASILGETSTNVSVKIHRALSMLRSLHEGTP